MELSAEAYVELLAWTFGRKIHCSTKLLCCIVICFASIPPFIAEDPKVGGIHFPKEVQTRLAFLDKVEILRQPCIGPLFEVLKERKLMPVRVGAGKGKALGSLTTTAILGRLTAARNKERLFRVFLSRCDALATSGEGFASGTFGRNNPITLALVTQAYLNLRVASRPAYKFAVKKLVSWILDGDEGTPCKGYPALLAEEALSKLDKSVGKPLRGRVKQARQKLKSWSIAEATRQIAFYHSSHPAQFDTGELVYVTLLSCRTQSLRWTDPLTTAAVRAAFKSQSEDSLWHSNRPFWSSSGHGYFLASSQILTAILRILRYRPDLYSEFEKRIEAYIGWLQNDIAKAVCGQETLWGWAAESDHVENQVDVYITAENLRVCNLIRTIISELNRNDLLRNSGLSVKWETMNWNRLVPVDLSQPEPQRIGSRLENLFVRPYKKEQELDRCSLVLYGPPGTSKTTIAEALGDALGNVEDRSKKSPTFSKSWPFVTITPGDFIAGGESMAEINAANIFRVLTELSNVVILFDEIDQLLKDRNKTGNQTGGALQFMTTSMLTKFQALRQKRKNIFVLTTNRFEELDIAIKRAGRFDCHLAVMPPDKPAREKILADLIKRYDEHHSSRFSKKIIARDMSVIATKTYLFTYPELLALTSDVLQALPSNANKKGIKKRLLDAAKKFPKATTLRSYQNRAEAVGEVSELLKRFSRTEFDSLTTEEKKDFAQLADRALNSEFADELPLWVNKNLVEKYKETTAAS